MSNLDTSEATLGAVSEQQRQEREQVLRITRSETFRSAQMLQHLLLYLAEKAGSGEAGALKEYSIGVEALGRRSEFDPKVDPIVRVQMHRLRQKLKEYYASEGSEDPLVLVVPKGHYLPRFDPAEVAAILEPEPSLDPGLSPEEEVAEQERSSSSLLIENTASSPTRSPRPMWILVGIVGFICGLAAAFLSIRIDQKTNTHLWSAYRTSDPVQEFWAQFLGNDQSPIIGYPDAVFLLDESNDLFRFRQGASDQRGALVNPDVTLEYAANPSLARVAGPLYYENGYTGTGELEGVGMLSSVFAKMGLKPTIKCSRDITTADLRQHNVILLGSPFQNTAVAQLPSRGDMLFENPDAHRELWRARIQNLHPGSNEEARYQTQRDPATGVLKNDYALVSIMPSVTPDLHIAIFAGLDTTGTQGATGFATSVEGAEKMKEAMTAMKRSESAGFQALLKVDLEKGYQVLDTQMITLHPIEKKRQQPTFSR